MTRKCESWLEGDDGATSVFFLAGELVICRRRCDKIIYTLASPFAKRAKQSTRGRRHRHQGSTYLGCPLRDLNTHVDSVIVDSWVLHNGGCACGAGARKRSVENGMNGFGIGARRSTSTQGLQRWPPVGDISTCLDKRPGFLMVMVVLVVAAEGLRVSEQ